MRFSHQQHGYSLVEVLVSISVLLIAIVGPMTIASQGIKSASFALEQNTAFFLAQEGIETIYALRGDAALIEYKSLLDESGNETSWDWVKARNAIPPCRTIAVGESCSFGIDFRDDDLFDNFTNSTCDPDDADDCTLYRDTSNSHSIYSHDNAGDASPYRRIVTLTRVSADVVVVDVVVKWESNVFASTQSVQASTELHDITFHIP